MSSAFEDLLLARSRDHGVAGLLHHHGASIGDWPVSLRDRLRQDAMGLAMIELQLRLDLKAVLSGLSTGGVRPILLKGTALAYSVYDQPATRPRGDTDFLIDADEKPAVDELLRSLGWRKSRVVHGDFVSAQCCYFLSKPSGPDLCLDVHWEINNSHVLTGLMDVEGLKRRAGPLPRLCDEAVGVSRVDALVHACVHRIGHLADFPDPLSMLTGERLIWLYDIHLLATAMTNEDWDELTAMAGDAAPALHDSLLAAHRHLGTRVPRATFGQAMDSQRVRKLQKFKAAGQLDRLWMEISEVKSVRNKVAYLWELVFPDLDYMRSRHPRANRAQLGLHYVGRAVGGLLKRSGWRTKS
ncbi:MAG: nucleotidyltransferase family protein [Hyphomicrobiaceae bacterium]